jgi:hypothetical protein
VRIAVSPPASMARLARIGHHGACIPILLHAMTPQRPMEHLIGGVGDGTRYSRGHDRKIRTNKIRETRWI